MKDVVKFLEKNGFKREENPFYPMYSNDKCKIIIYKDNYVIVDNKDGRLYSADLAIYWLIGALTYYGYMDKNYKQ